MKRYDYIELALFIIIPTALSCLFAWLLFEFTDNNKDEIDRWIEATSNFVGEKYNEFVDKYAPRD